MSARRTKAYLVYLSTSKHPIPIDEEELEKVIEAGSKGGLVIVKRGVINPAFVGHIAMDLERVNEWQDACRYGGGEGEKTYAAGLRPLSHIYTAGGFIGNAVEASTKKLEEKLPKQLEQPKKE